MLNKILFGKRLSALGTQNRLIVDRFNGKAGRYILGHLKVGARGLQNLLQLNLPFLTKILPSQVYPAAAFFRSGRS